MFGIEIRIDRFGAAEVEHAEVVAADKEVSWVGVGVECAEVVDLVGVKIPERLPDDVAKVLRRGAVGKDIEWLAIHPIHRDHAAVGKFWVVFREADLGEVCAGRREACRVAEFLFVVGFLE